MSDSSAQLAPSWSTPNTVLVDPPPPLLVVLTAVLFWRERAAFKLVGAGEGGAGELEDIYVTKISVMKHLESIFAALFFLEF